MSRLSVAVMAHRKREAFIPSLLTRLGIEDDRVVWDRRNDRWDTGRRAMLHHDPDATHHLVVQDDAVVCQDLIPGLEQALNHVPEKTPLCLYVGRLTPFDPQTTAAAQQATDDGASWLSMDGLHWGVGIVMPTQMIAPMIQWGDTRGRHVPNYDKRISRWLGEQHISTWYPWPSLVDHRDSPSLVAGRRSKGRFAHQFVGADRSALDVDWSGPVMNIRVLRRYGSARHKPRPTPRRRPMTTAAKTTPIVTEELMTPRRTVTIHHERRRHKVRIGETVAHKDSWIVRHKPDLWKPLVVHYPPEPLPEEPQGDTPDGDDPNETPDREPAADPEEEPAAKDVRAWAKEQGIDVPTRGKPSTEVVDQYKQAMADETPTSEDW